MARRRSVSLVIADTESYRLARRAVERSVAGFAVEEVLVYSDDPSAWPGLQVRRIPRIASSADYNRTILQTLAEHLRTDYALVIQFDGFVLNPHAFSDFFFEFDYLGAPWPAGMQVGRTRLREATVGNGGFSLRSRRLVEEVARLAPALGFNALEDALVCRYLRPILEEQAGIEFAPPEVARRFSLEMEPVAGTAPFGFHGMHILPQAYRDDLPFLLDNLAPRCLEEGSYQLTGLRNGCKLVGPHAVQLLEARLQRLRQDRAAGPVQLSSTVHVPVTQAAKG